MDDGLDEAAIAAGCDDYERSPRFSEAEKWALRYADQLAAAMPGPVEMDRTHFMLDPFVHTLFGSPQPIQGTLCLSRAMQEYMRRPDAGMGDIYALMGMRRNEKRTFGMESEGDVLRRDVAQQTISFSDHTLSCITHSEAETRAEVAWSIFDSLIGRVARHVEDMRQEKSALDKHRDDLMAHPGEVHAQGPTQITVCSQN